MKNLFLFLFSISLLTACSSDSTTDVDLRDQYIGTYKGSFSSTSTLPSISVPADVSLSKTSIRQGGIELTYQSQPLTGMLDGTTITVFASTLAVQNVRYNVTGTGKLTGTGDVVNKKMELRLTGVTSGTANTPINLTFSGSQ